MVGLPIFSTRENSWTTNSNWWLAIYFQATTPQSTPPTTKKEEENPLSSDKVKAIDKEVQQVTNMMSENLGTLRE